MPQCSSSDQRKGKSLQLINNCEDEMLGKIYNGMTMLRRNRIIFMLLCMEYYLLNFFLADVDYTDKLFDFDAHNEVLYSSEESDRSNESM